MAAGSGKVEVSSLWTDAAEGDSAADHADEPASGDHLQSGRFIVPVPVVGKRAPLAVAAPGLR